MNGLAVASGCVKLFDISDLLDPKLKYTVSRESKATVRSIQWTNKYIGACGDDGIVAFSDRESGAVSKTYGPLSDGSSINCFSVLPGNVMASGGSNRSVILWDLRTRAQRKILGVHFGSVLSMDVRTDTNAATSFLAAGDATGTIFLYNLLDTSLAPKALHPFDAQEVKALTFDKYAPGPVLCAASSKGMITSVDCENASPIWSLKAHTGEISSLVQSQVNGNIITVGDDKKMIISSSRSSKVLETVDLYESKTGASVDIHNDGNTLGIGTKDGYLLLYDLRRLSAPISSLRVSDTSVTCLKFEKQGALSSTLAVKRPLSGVSASLSLVSSSHSSSVMGSNDSSDGLLPEKRQATSDSIGGGSDNKRIELSFHGTEPRQSIEPAHTPSSSGQSVIPELMQATILQKIVEDSQMEFRQQIKNDMINMHVDMLKNFEIMQSGFVEAMEKLTDEMHALVEENKRLKAELDSLKKKGLGNF